MRKVKGVSKPCAPKRHCDRGQKRKRDEERFGQDENRNSYRPTKRPRTEDLVKEANVQVLGPAMSLSTPLKDSNQETFGANLDKMLLDTSDKICLPESDVSMPSILEDNSFELMDDADNLATESQRTEPLSAQSELSQDRKTIRLMWRVKYMTPKWGMLFV